ncbi:unnamed protein product [Lampetra planeri]
MGNMQGGSVMVQLATGVQACPVELLRQRRTYNGLVEYLIRWHVSSAEENGGCGGGGSPVACSSASDPAGKSENILMWMSEEEVCACCGGLLGNRKPEGTWGGWVKADMNSSSDDSKNGIENDVHAATTGTGHRNTLGETGLEDQEFALMKGDVQKLVQRARRQVERAPGPEATHNISHIIHVLSAYASIGPLAGVFKEAGALDLLMELLCNNETQTRRSAGRMLRALASHDAGSRAYVLLSLSQQDGIEQHMDFDNRFTLLELFAETTSSEEHGMSFEGIHLPQIPGKLLFSLVKRYLCVTSLMDRLNNCDGHADKEDTSPGAEERLWLQRKFEFTMAMANLIVELVKILGWDCSREERQSEEEHSDGTTPPRGPHRSIFQAPPARSTHDQPAKPKADANLQFKTFNSFSTRSSYVEYVQQVLRPGMRVRMREDYEQVNAGDQGEFKQSNDGRPPVQVLWDSMSRTFWVYWHMIEILSEQSAMAQPKLNLEKTPEFIRTMKPDPESQSRPLGSFYMLPYLSEGTGEHDSVLSRNHWWELLFFLKKLEGPHQAEACDIISATAKLKVSSLDDISLISFLPKSELACQLLQHLIHTNPPFRKDLEMSQVSQKFAPKSSSQLLEDNTTFQNTDSTFSDKLLQSSPVDIPALSSSKKSKKDDTSPSSSSACQSNSKGESAKQGGASLRTEDLEKVEGVEEKLCQFDSVKSSTKKTFLAKGQDVWEIMKQSQTDVALHVAGLQTMQHILEEDTSSNKKPPTKLESGQSTKDKLLNALVEEMDKFQKEKVVVLSVFRVIIALLQKVDYHMLFAIDGGIQALLSCMQQHADVLVIQQLGLECLRVVIRAEQFVLPAKRGKARLVPDADCRVIREVVSSIASATEGGSPGLLVTIPAAIERMLSTQGCGAAVVDGLQVVIKLMTNHKSLAEHLARAGLQRVLYQCLANAGGAAGGAAGGPALSARSQQQQQQQSVLAVTALGMLTEFDLVSEDSASEQSVVNWKDVELRTILASLRKGVLSKELVLSLERWMNSALLEPQLTSIVNDLDIFKALVQALDKLRSEKVVQLAVVRMLTIFLEKRKGDSLPWHEALVPFLSVIGMQTVVKEVQQEFVRFMYRLASENKDYAIVMCRVGGREAITRALDKHGPGLLLGAELRDLVADCEKYAKLYKQLTTSILAGCIQMVLGQIEESRRTQQPISIPFFNIFLRNICQGSNVEVKEDKCWEKVEVSSNEHRVSKLLDGNPKTYWESNGSTGSHFITITMLKGVIIRRLSLLVASEDSSYMPARIVAMGGDDPNNINTELNAVNVPSSASKVVLLENMTRFWPIIQIRVKRCQQGGIDTRVHGFEILGPKPTFWPVFREQLCRRTCLFYTVKAHAWTEAVRLNRLHMLQLYNKLGAVLRHEQSFTEQFLPDPEAAQALGQTCWEALVTPIVSSITAEGSGEQASPFRWLLQEYLSQNEQHRRAGRSKALVFASRVRRLCRLLVHANTNPIASADIHVPAKPTGVPPGSLPRCCAKGAQTKDKDFEFDEAGVDAKRHNSVAPLAACWASVVQAQVSTFLSTHWNSAEFAEKYGVQFTQLSAASRELFGNHVAFAVALREGFRSALLQLSHNRALKVCEIFAQYTDRLIRAIGSEGTGGDPFSQLKTTLEPIVFLSGLEMANTFEHFYRFYLAERLLTLGPHYAEVEAVMELALCFPAKFPQRLLQDVAESTSAMTDFQQHQLEQFDRRMAALSDEEMEEDEREGEVDPGDCAGLRAMVLSPACWASIIQPSCSLSNPAVTLPHALQYFLHHYEQFFTDSQKTLAAFQQQPKRLQWTWLGHAELQTPSGTLLQVTTLQMYILMQFNDGNEVSIEKIQKDTHVTSYLLKQCLQALADAPFLQLLGSLDGDSLKGSLKLREEALQALPQRERLSLLPSPCYSSSEQLVTRALEKRRNVISCAVVHLLKREKQLHFDNLVFRVVNACQKGRLGGRPVPRFVCGVADVSWCVERLLRQGYVSFRDDMPHILRHTSDTDSANPTNRRAFCNWLSLEPSKDAESGASAADERECGRPLSSLASSASPVRTRTLTPTEVWPLMEDATRQLVDVLGMEAGVAEHLLVHCGWNVDEAVQRYLDSRDKLLSEAGIEGPPARDPTDGAAADQQPTCPICLGVTGEVELLAPLYCTHRCCKSCWRAYLRTSIDQNMLAKCTCPIMDCPAQPTGAFIRTMMEDDSDRLELYKRALLRGYVESCSNLAWCANPQGCDRVLCKDGTGGHAATCAKCHWSTCFSCSFLEAHCPASCTQIAWWVDEGGYYEGMSSDALSKHLAKLISKPCPSCHAQIEKNEGCLHMTCAKCNHSFCWRCLKAWAPTHTEYYNCSTTVSKAAKREKQFQEYNEMCIFYHQAKDFALKMKSRVESLDQTIPGRTVMFVLDACEALAKAQKTLAYSSVYKYYSQDTTKLGFLEQQTDNLETHAGALQALLEETVLQGSDLASAVRALRSQHMQHGLQLIGMIHERLGTLLGGSTQDFQVGMAQSATLQDTEGVKLSTKDPLPRRSSDENMDEDGEDYPWEAGGASLFSRFHNGKENNRQDDMDEELDSDGETDGSAGSGNMDSDPCSGDDDDEYGCTQG